MNTLKKKYAVIFPGNLSTYFLCINNFKIMCESKNIDIYILYSKNINYCHTGFVGTNKTFKITDEDIKLIKKKLGSNIKYFKSIEETEDYKTIIDKYIKHFQKNIEWSKDSDIKWHFNYKKFMIYENCRKYLDQFVRTYYLYNIIKDSNINYDYIIRMRIDQYYDKILLRSVFNTLDNHNYNFTWNSMDNFYIVHNDYYKFFDYLINKLGAMKSDKTGDKTWDEYILGPERQFRMIVNSFIINPKTFKEVNANSHISISIFDNKRHYMYLYTNGNSMPFGSYCIKKSINLGNYEEKLNNDKSIVIRKNKLYGEKYNGNIFWVYTIYENK